MKPNDSLKAAAATAARGRTEAEVRASLGRSPRFDAKARTYVIAARRRPDDVEEFFFKVDGEVRKSSYDRKFIKDFALGYAGREVAIVEVAS